MSNRFARNCVKNKRLKLSARKLKCKGPKNIAAWRERQKELKSVTEYQEDNAEVFSEIGDAGISGRRIVNLKNFIEDLQTLNQHSPLGCTLSNMQIISEKRCGLRSAYKFRCNMCNFEKVVWSERMEQKTMNVNAAAVTGIMSIGCGFSNMEEFFSVLDIPPMSINTFNKEHNTISEAWEETALKEMELAGIEERNIAIEKGHVDVDGIPYITVIADGSWAKRSYRTNYSSLSGVAAIVGLNTKKVLFIGVRNKYCVICAKAQNKKVSPIPDHRCFKNWSGSSSGMEADIIVEGFSKSIEMHNLKYKCLIADGDSNVYKKILDGRPYDNITVQKIECKNHLLRNMCNKLKDITKNSKTGNVMARKLLGERIMRIRTSIVMATKHRKGEKTNSFEKSVTNLHDDIINTPMHVLGSHEKCASYFCNKTKKEKGYTPFMKDSGVLYRIMDVMNSFSNHSRSLLEDVNNNVAEQFNSIIAKFVGGKRINYCLRRGYQARCNAAVVAFNSKSPMYSLHKKMYKCSPGKCSKLMEKKRASQNLKRRKTKRASRKLFNTQKADQSYGFRSEKPDIPAEMFERKKNDLINNLQLTDRQRNELFLSTISQSQSPLWMEERRKRLTASNFGIVCKRLPHTSCHNLVKSILYGHFENCDTKYGSSHERDVVAELSEKNIVVQPCGLFVDRQNPFLAATPDGLLEENGILEIKCPSSCQDLTPEEAILSRKFTFWTVDKNTQSVGEINKKHNYFYQVQGQLHVSNRDFCLFVMWTPKGMKMEKIDRDDSFWRKEMSEKLIQFYYNCLLPELVDPRYTRSMQIRDPIYIIEAQKRKEEGKRAKESENKL